MKRFLSLLFVSALLLTAARATEGDPNIDAGGGSMGSGSGASSWNPGNDGVRVSVMSGTTALCTFDMSNEDRSWVQRAFIRKDKLYYKRGGQLTFRTDAYTNHVPPPDMPLPTIIPSGGGSSIGAVRRYFTDRRTVEFIADIAGMDYDRLVSGDYKLLLEPVSYFKYNGVQYAMSATEAALYDVKVSGDLRYQMGKLTHQNQPLGMFLERSDLGIPAWTGATSGKQSDIDILNQLGVGIVSFYPEDLTPDPPSGDYVYRTDTDVITAALVPNLVVDSLGDGVALTPDAPGRARFVINGVTYAKDMICPAGGSQYVWVRWHTPSTPCEFTITVIPPGSSSSYEYISISVSVVALEENVPPNAEYDGPGEGPGITGTQYRPSFTPPECPDWGNQRTATWSQWIAELETDGIFVWWTFSMATYSAELSVDYKLVPNERVQTEELRGGKYIMKSGYGVDAVCQARVSSRGNVSTYDVTKVQNVVAAFPEFDYEGYDRFLEPDRNAYSTTWRFKSNPYSYYGERVHFTPLWYPDGDYTVPLAVFDVWTPGGMLYASVRDTIQISGDMYDDWYIHVYDQ